MLMTEVGRTGKYSVYDYLGYLDAFPVKNCLITKLIDVVMLLSVLLGFTVSGHFFWVFAALLGYHSFIYMKQKRKVEPYLTTFSYFIRILECVDKLNKMSPAFHQEFAEEIAKKYPQLEILFCVRGDVILNDATRADAETVGIPFPVIDNGNRVPGTQIDLLSKEALEALNTADVILAKGMANCETMFGCGYNVYYAFLVKCQRFVDRFQKPMLTPMLVRERA